MKKKSMLALLLTASMLFAAGCGSTAQSTASDETAEAAEETAEEAAEAEEEAAVEADDAEAEDAEDAGDTEEGAEEDADMEAAQKVADLIDAIYVQERTDETDAQCEEAKEAWDALTDEQKELVEGEEADPEYFGRDTGDASLDDPGNEDEIGDNELLVVSFGTSFNDSRVEDIHGIETALAEAYPDWSVRRALPHRSSSTMCRPETARRSTM